MSLLLLFLCVVSDPILDAPDIGTEGFRPDTLARCANELLALGEEGAYRKLSDAATDGTREVQTKIVLLTTMLYRVDAPKPIRGPRLGASLYIPDRELNAKEWPLRPLAMVDGIPLLITHGYILGGLPENAKDYLDHCRKQGQFRQRPFIVATRTEVQAAIEKLLNSARWANIAWSAERETGSHQINQDWVVELISNALDAMPEYYTAEEILDVMARVSGSIAAGKTEPRGAFLKRVGLSLGRLTHYRREPRGKVVYESYQLNPKWQIQWMSDARVAQLGEETPIYGVRITHLPTEKVVVRSW